MIYEEDYMTDSDYELLEPALSYVIKALAEKNAIAHVHRDHTSKYPWARSVTAEVEYKYGRNWITAEAILTEDLSDPDVPKVRIVLPRASESGPSVVVCTPVACLGKSVLRNVNCYGEGE